MKNRGDYWTKHNCMAHHQTMRPEILTPRCQFDAIRESFREKNSF